MIFSRPCVAEVSFRRRVSLRVFLPFSFLSPLDSPPRRTSPASRAAANIQYTVILARVRDCVRLLPTLRADAIGKKTTNPTAVQVRAVTSQQESQMQRRAFLMRAGAGVAATAVARPAIAQTGTPVRWRLATSWPKSLDTLYGSVEAMCQRVGQLTDRKFQIQSFAGGEIVPRCKSGMRRKTAPSSAATRSPRSISVRTPRSRSIPGSRSGSTRASSRPG